MTTRDPVCRVVNCISLKASPSSHMSHISHAVSSTTATDNDVTMVSSSGEYVLANRSLLSLASPFLLDLLASTPCCISPTLLLPDFSTHSLNHLVSIVTNGFTTSHLGNSVFRDINQVIDMAKLMKIPIADLSYERSYSELETLESSAEKQIDIKVELVDELDQQIPVIESCTSLQIDKDFINDETIIELSEKDNLNHSFTALPKAANNQGLQKNNHSSQDVFTCDECGKDFKSMSKLKLHKTIHSNISLSNLNGNAKVPTKGASKEFTCSICKKTFASKYNLDQHMHIHTGFKPYKCDSCGKGFIAKNKKNKHALKCLNTEMNNEVDYKDLESEDKGMKRSKTIIHEQEVVRENENNSEPHDQNKNDDTKCNICRKRFTNADSLDAHLKCGCDKPHQCPYCPAKFFHVYNVRRHIKMKHPNESSAIPISGEKSHQCPYCPAMFLHAGNISRHVKSKHSVDKDASIESKNSIVKNASTESKNSNDKEAITENVVSAEDTKVMAKSKEQSKYSLFIHKCCYCSKVFLKEKYMKVHKKKCQLRSLGKTEDKQNEDQNQSEPIEKSDDSKSIKLSVTEDVGNEALSDCPKFKCPFCSEEFQHREDWDLHIDIYHNISDDE